MKIADWENLLETITCCQIGEENYYRRHLQKQAVARNKHAINLIDSQHKYQACIESLQHSIHLLHTFGYEIIKTICDMVIKMDAFEISTCQHWNVCALTGTLCRECLTFVGDCNPNSVIYVDSIFKDFFECIWILHHVEQIQISRIVEYETENTEDKCSISDKIANFLKSTTKETKKIASTLVSCENYINNSLQKSLQQIEAHK